MFVQDRQPNMSFDDRWSMVMYNQNWLSSHLESEFDELDELDELSCVEQIGWILYWAGVGHCPR